MQTKVDEKSPLLKLLQYPQLNIPQTFQITWLYAVLFHAEEQDFLS